MKTIQYFQGEAEWLDFTVFKRGTRTEENLTGCTFHLAVKRNIDDITFTFEKDNADFDSAMAANGRIAVFLDATDTNLYPGQYEGEVTVTYTGTPASINKDLRFKLEILAAVQPSP